MSVTYEFDAQVRTEQGKKFARRMRRDQDLVPAVVYGAGKAPKAISLLHKDIFHALENEAVFSHILKLRVDGAVEQVVIKDVQRHVFKPKIVHVDFLRVKAKEKITMHVPLHFEGEEEAPGIKSGEAKFTKSIVELEIRCLPADLPEFIALDVSKMALDDVLHLSDIKLPTGVELALSDLDEEHDQPVIGCHIPKVSQEDIEAEQHEAELAEEAAASSETKAEVEGEAKEAAAEAVESEAEGGEKTKDEQ